MNLYLVLKLKKDLFLDMNRYQILIEYVGTNFIGWQIQPKGKSIQKIIQLKISKLLKEKIKLVGSGRTDTGVHAEEQSAHFDTKNEIDNLNKFLKSINTEKRKIIKLIKEYSIANPGIEYFGDIKFVFWLLSIN